MCSTSLKALDGSQLQEHCTAFAKTFTRPGTNGAPDICDVELNALISELSVMKFTLPDTPMSAVELLSLSEKRIVILIFLSLIGFYLLYP
jgi:hypothetical protein